MKKPDIESNPLSATYVLQKGDMVRDMMTRTTGVVTGVGDYGVNVQQGEVTKHYGLDRWRLVRV